MYGFSFQVHTFLCGMHLQYKKIIGAAPEAEIPAIKPIISGIHFFADYSDIPVNIRLEIYGDVQMISGIIFLKTMG